jgi:hypothetical protein
LFAWIEFISDSIANCQLAASVALIAFVYVVGLLASVKKRLGENRSGGCNSLSDQCVKTRLAGSSVVVLRTSELISVELARSAAVGLLGFGVIVPSVLGGWADHEADLV